MQASPLLLAHDMGWLVDSDIFACLTGGEVRLSPGAAAVVIEALGLRRREELGRITQVRELSKQG